MKMSKEEMIEEIKRKIADLKIVEEEKSTRNIDWKSYDEVKAYLDNIFIEYSFQCYGEKKPDGCYRLANFHENVRNQFEEATNLHKKTCDDYKYPRSCYHYANALLFGRGCKVDYKEAFKYNVLSCELGTGNSCNIAGMMILKGDSGEETKDVKRAKEFLEKACDKNIQDACINLFGLYMNGVNYGLDGNEPEKAIACAKKSCDELENIVGCVNATVMYKNGDGIEKNEKMAKVYEQKAKELQKRLQRPPPGVVFGEQHKKV